MKTKILLLMLLGLVSFYVYESNVQRSVMSVTEAPEKASAAQVDPEVNWNKFLQGQKIGILMGKQEGSERHARGFNKLKERIPQSQWYQNLSRRYSGQITTGNFDVLVAPVGTQEFELDNIARRMIQRYLADVLVRRYGKRIPDVDIVNALLEGMTRYPDEDKVRQIALRFGVKRIIWIYAGHTLPVRSLNKLPEMQFSVAVQDRDRHGFDKLHQLDFRHWDNILISDEHQPEEAFYEHLDSVVKFIDPGVPVNQKPASGVQDSPVFSDKLYDLFSSSDLLNDIYNLQIMGAMISERSFSQLEDTFFERSLVMAKHLPEEHPRRKATISRAMFFLNRRPAAIKYLQNPGTSEELALIALYNGNLPELKKRVDDEENKVVKLLSFSPMAWLIEKYLKYDQEKAYISDKIAEFGELAWPLTKKIQQEWIWEQYSNIEYKLILDDAFNLKDYTAADVVGPDRLPGISESQQAAIATSPQRHIAKYIKKNKLTDGSIRQSLTRLDLLEYLGTMADENISKKLRFYTGTQALPSRAVKFFKSIEPVYSGHPEVVYEYNQAIRDMMASLPGEEQSLYRKILSENMELTKQYYSFANTSKFPVSAYSMPVKGSGLSSLLRADSYVHDSVRFLRAYMEQYPSARDKDKHPDIEKVYQSNTGRFAGSPERIQLVESYYESKGEPIPEHELLGFIRDDPNQINFYQRLARIYFMNKETDKAYALYRSFPGVANPEELSLNRVSFVNYLYAAGANFYWLGEFKKASEFFTSLSLDTGAGSEYIGKFRLAILDKDIYSAINIMEEVTGRYEVDTRNRDLVSLLSAAGDHELAYKKLRTLRWGSDSLARMQALDNIIRQKKHDSESIRRILRENNLHNSRSLEDFMVRQVVIDRKVVPEELDYYAMSAVPRWGKTMSPVAKQGLCGSEASRQDEIKLLKREINKTRMSLDLEKKRKPPSDPKHAADAKKAIEWHARNLKQMSSKLKDLQGPKRSPIGLYSKEAVKCISKDHKGPGQLLISAFASLQANNFNDAYANFLEIAEYYTIESYDLTAYMAYALMKSGDEWDKSYFRSWLETKTSDPMFSNNLTRYIDYSLARAVIHGFDHNHDAAISEVKNAYSVLPYETKNKIPGWYRILDITERLYLETKNESYRQLLDTYADNFIMAKPWVSWLYGFKATATNSESEKLLAIGYLQYLDPGSMRLQRFSPDLVSKAAKQLKTKNIFINRKKVKKPSSKSAYLRPGVPNDVMVLQTASR